ncbi:hypothetical protein P5V15_009231 [Pogonomyrmex californicus]
MAIQWHLCSAEGDAATSYVLKKFHNKPGIYFEEIKLMNQVQTTWKLVIKLDINTLEKRARQMENYLDQTNERCKSIIGSVQFTCKNIMQKMQKDNAKLTQLLTRLRTIYYTRDSKRGLINAIGAINKTLFGTMDAEDEEHLNKQIQMLQENQ